VLFCVWDQNVATALGKWQIATIQRTLFARSNVSISVRAKNFRLMTSQFIYDSTIPHFLVECDEGWLTHDNSCYKHKFNSETFKPENGQAYCALAYNAHLLVPNSKQESSFIAKYLRALKV